MLNAPALTLEVLASRHGTDKGSVHSYAKVYEKMFSKWKDKPLALLEIGVYHCESMRMWLDYFPNAEVVGMDIDLMGQQSSGRLTLLECDQTDGPKMRRLLGGRCSTS